MGIISGQFIDTYFPVIDCSTLRINNYSYWLNKNYGHTIIFIPNTHEHSDEVQNNLIRFKLFETLRRDVTTLGVNLIHVHSPYNSGKLALKIATLKHIPIVATFELKHIEEIKEKYKVGFISNIITQQVMSFYSKVDAVFTATQSNIDLLKSMGYKGRIELIEDGTDYTYENDLYPYRDYINHRYDILDETNVLLYVGELSAKKNMSLILDAVLNMKKLKQRFKMLFVGEGNAKDEMMKFVEQHKLTRYVVFAGEINDRDILKKFYARANLFLFPSNYDSQGYVIRDAASLRCPSLILKETNTIEFIKDNVNGYLSENNGLSYAQRIIAALNDMNKVKVGLNAQSTLAKSYEVIVDQLYEQYTDIIIKNKQFLR